ncbi:peptide ABC transporter substrate-binding protein [Patescibacteria group bacterium]|nr:peptide ABC transporter substrate-binding protein [Patescibacteria group bacterium]
MFTFFTALFRALTRTERLIIAGATVVLVLSLSILGILLFHAITVEVPAPSPLYTEGMVGQPIAVNPILADTNDVDRALVRLTFASVSDLSESVKPSPDDKTWDIILKPNLTWSDGKPLTSDDIIFTINSLQDPDSHSPLAVNWQGVIANRISEREVEFTLRTPYVFFADNLKELYPIPEHIWGSVPVANFGLSNFNLAPVGDGPYAYLSYEKKENGFITAYHLTTDPSYSGSKPLINDFTMRFYQSQADLIDAFNAHEIDGFGGLDPKNSGAITLSNALLEKDMPVYYAVFFNKNTPGLDDQNVIQAMLLAVNKQQIIDSVFSGKASIVNGPVLPSMEGFDASSTPADIFAPDKANALLDKAGWAPNDSGVRADKTTTLEFSLTVPQVPSLVDTANILQEEMKAIGIKLDINIVQPNDLANDIIKTRNYQMILYGNVLKQSPDLFAFWHSSEKFYPGLNLALYGNKQVDSLLEDIRQNPDQTKRDQDLSKVQQLITDDEPAIFLYSPKYLYVAPMHFGGFDTSSIAYPADRFSSVSSWYLKTTRVFTK